MSFRIELKTRLTASDLLIMKSDLSNNGMLKLYPSRLVKSIYYDTLDHSMYHNSEEGILPRKKIRIRSYGNSGIYRLEKKISSYEGRFKTSSEIDFSSVSKCIYDKDYGVIKPILEVSYVRDYFSFQGLRLTFDNAIKYKYLRGYKRLTKYDFESVMEIKTGVDKSIDEIMMKVPNLRISRFSKYCRGLEFFI